jgi:hypothetical protein
MVSHATGREMLRGPPYGHSQWSQTIEAGTSGQQPAIDAAAPATVTSAIARAKRR